MWNGCEARDALLAAHGETNACGTGHFAGAFDTPQYIARARARMCVCVSTPVPKVLNRKGRY